MGRSSWGRDLPTISILFPKGHLLLMVLLHLSHFLIFLRLSFFEQSWQPSLQRSDFSHNFCCQHKTSLIGLIGLMVFIFQPLEEN